MRNASEMEFLSITQPWPHGFRRFQACLSEHCSFLNHRRYQRHLAPMTANLPRSPLFLLNPKADIILRSSDNVNFYAIKFLLSYSSPFFESMFALPPPVEDDDKDEIKDGLCVVKLAEHSQILERVLLLCYPTNVVDGVLIRDLEDASELLNALEKYEMTHSWKRVWGMFLASPFVKRQPLRAFAFACRQKRMEIARLAARYLTSDVVFSRRDHHEDPNYRFFSYWELLRTQDFRQKCAEAVYVTITSLCQEGEIAYAYTSASGNGHGNGCQMNFYPNSTPVFDWWGTYFNSARDALADNRCGAAVLDPAYLAAAVKKASDSKCKICQATVARELPAYSTAFCERIEEAVSKVSIYISFSLTRCSSYILRLNWISTGEENSRDMMSIRSLYANNLKL